MIELGLGIAMGAGVTWLLNRRNGRLRPGSSEWHSAPWACHQCREPFKPEDTTCRGCGEGLANIRQAALAQLDHASSVLENLSLTRPGQGIREALDAVASRRLSLLEWKSEGLPRVRESVVEGKGGAESSWVVAACMVLSAVCAGAAGIAFGGGIASGLPWAMAALSVGSVLATFFKRNPFWAGWACVAMLAGHAGMVGFWISGRSENDLMALEAAFRPIVLAALGVGAGGWLGCRVLSGGRMAPVQAWLAWGSILLLAAGAAKSKSMEEGLPALMWAMTAFSASVGVFSRWACGGCVRNKAFGQLLQSLAVGMGIIWVGAGIKGAPWGQLASIAAAVALVFTGRGLAWRSFGWTVAGAFAGVGSIIAATRSMEMGWGFALQLAGIWVGAHGLLVLGAGRAWRDRRKAWFDGWICTVVASLASPACAALVCRFLLIDADALVDFGAISGSPLYLLGALLMSLACAFGPGRRGFAAWETALAVGWIMVAGWASNLGTLHGLAVLAVGGLVMSAHATSAWLPAVLSALSILATVGLELKEPATWPVVLQVISATGIITGFVLGMRNGARWWHYSGLSVIPLVLGLAGGANGSVTMVVAGLAAGWSVLGLALRIVRFTEGEDREGSPRLALLTASMTCGVVFWTLGVQQESGVLPMSLAVVGGFAGFLAMTRFGDLAQRQGMALATALLASAQAGVAISCWGGLSDQAAMASVAAAGPGIAVFLGVLMILCHDLSPLVLLAARASVALVPVAVLGMGSESLMTRLALPWTAGMWAVVGWMVSVELDRRRKVVAIGWRSAAVQAAVASFACLGWAMNDPLSDPFCLKRLGMASCGSCLGLVLVACVEGGRVSVPWLTRKSCRLALQRVDWCAVAILAVSLSTEAACYSDPGRSAWQGLPAAAALASAFAFYIFSRFAREGQCAPWAIILPAAGMFLHLTWTSNRGPEENLALLFLASACLVALGGAWHAAGRARGGDFRVAGLGAIAVVVGFCLLEARGTSPEGPQRAFFQGGMVLPDQAARGLNVGLVLAGTLVVAGLTGGTRAACSSGAALALGVGVLRQALDGQPWVAVVPQGLGVLALATALLRRDREQPPLLMIGASGRESRAA